MRARPEIAIRWLGRARSQHARRLGCVFAMVLAMVFATTLGCERTRLVDGYESTDRCTACHGMPGNPAPPYALHGEWHTTDLAVGAHQVHLVEGTMGAGVPCYECHPIPTELVTHPNWSGKPTSVTFGALATLARPAAAPAAPAWDRATGTCTNVYCHGATMAGAAQRPPPVWTRVDGSQKSCSSCHGFPPNDDNHRTTAGCETCHGVVSGPGGVIVNRARHVDGRVDLGAASGATNARPTTAEPLVARPTTAEPLVARPTTAEPLVARPTTAEPLVAPNAPTTFAPKSTGEIAW